MEIKYHPQFLMCTLAAGTKGYTRYLTQMGMKQEPENPSPHTTE